MGRTRRRTHVAGHTFDPALFITVEPVYAPVDRWQNWPFLGELHRHLGHEHMLHGGLKAGKQGWQVEPLGEADLRLLDPPDVFGSHGHGRTLAKKTRSERSSRSQALLGIEMNTTRGLRKAPQLAA